jgi:hypothetical protein
VIYIHQKTGQWLISKKAVEAQSQIFKNLIWEANPSKNIEQNPPVGNTFRRGGIIQNVVQYLPSVIYHYLRAYHFSLWLFLFFGLIKVRCNVIAFELFVGSLVLFHLFSLSTFIPSTTRFSVPVIPLSLIWAGAGVLGVHRFLQKIKIDEPGRWVFFLVILFIIVQLPQSLRPERSHREEQKKIGLWLKENTPPDAIIMSNSPQETFYADREFVLLPLGVSGPGDRGQSYDEVIQYARAKGVRYILVNKNTHEINPGFIASIALRDLKEIYRGSDRASIIYEVIY